jgi:hypothetical protein
MTAAEKQRFASAFPNLNVQNAVVTDGPTPAYNCIAWTVGVTNRWIWPGNTIAQFDAFYRGFGYSRTNTGPLAVWGHTTANMTHGCISGPGHGPRWESKCGADLRIQHGLTELVGSNYGRVTGFYDRTQSVGGPWDDMVAALTKQKGPKPYLTPAAKQKLRRQVDTIPADLRARFERAFSTWKQAWFEGGLTFNSNPQTRSVGRAFDALISLGPGILPLVVEKLADPENFLALQLYDAIQPDPTLVVHFEADDQRILEGEQGRARRTVETWLAKD